MGKAYRRGMGKIAEKLDRSAATVHAQIHTHDEDIDKQGYCAECRRLKGTHEAHKTDSRNKVTQDLNEYAKLP